MDQIDTQEPEVVQTPHGGHLWKFVGAAAFLVLSFGFLYLFYIGNPAQSFEELVSVTVSPKWVNQAQFAGIFVANDLGFYEEEGLEVEINEFRANDSVLNDLKTSESHFGLMSANEFLSYYSKGEDLKAIAAFYQISPYVIASLKRQNILSPIEFKGKRLGVKGGGGAEALTVFDLLLLSAGLEPDDVEFVNLPLGPSEREDLLDERADIIGFYRTRLYQFDKEGLNYNLVLPEQYGAALYNDVLVAQNSFLEAYPDIAERFLRATIKGWEYAYDNQDEAVAITLRYVTQQGYRDIEYEKYILETSEALMRPEGKIQIGQMTLEKWYQAYGALRARGFLNRDFDVADAFTLEYLPY